VSSEPDLSALEYEIRGNAAVWHVMDFQTLYEEEIEEGQELYVEKSGDDSITATVVRFDGAPTLGADEQEYINEVWSELAQAVEIERAAYVGDGITALAVESNVDAPGVEVQAFNDQSEAIEWARDGE
jgi:hypothetical protein